MSYLTIPTPILLFISSSLPKIIPFIAFHFQNINSMQQLILMLKKSKKQRKAFDFKEVESIKQPQDYSANNSSSIIAIDEYSHQTSQQHLTFKPNVHEPQVIKISATKTLDFQDQCMQNEQFKQEIVSITDIGVSHSIQERKEEEELDEKKETVTTNNDSSRQEIHKKAMIEKIQEKALTEHFSYASEQQQSEDEQEIQQMDTRSQKVLKKFVAETLDDLIFAKIPQNCNVTCAVSFNHQFLSFSRKYDLFLVREKKYLFSAVKPRLKLTSQFEFIRNGDKKQSPVGYLKSNFTGLQFVANKVHRNEGDRQTEVCWIGYEFNMLGLSSQRSITVLKNKNAKLQKIQNFSKIKNYYENGITENFEKFSTKKAVVNREGEYELDFHGKVNKPSGKNFILVNTKQKQCILFGKRTDNTFVLQIGYPFSIFEGFAIAISSLDHKLCVR